MRFNDDTTIREFLDAIRPLMEAAESRGELTRAQEGLGAACHVAEVAPESQTARDLLAWAHGSTPEGCMEAARAEGMEAWIAPEDIALAESL